jgi:hypothetical protein
MPWSARLMCILILLAMPLGGVGTDYVNLNVDSLWTGGPFENTVSRAIMFWAIKDISDYV